MPAFEVPDISNWDLAIVVALLSSWSLISNVGRLIGLLPVLLITGIPVLMSVFGLRQWYSCPALRALGWTVPRPRFFAISVITGLSAAFAVALVVRAAGTSIICDPAATAVLTVTIGPIVEELFFRGFLQPCLAAITGAIPAVIITAISFAAIHGPISLLQFSCFTVTGAAYGFLRLRSGSVAASTLMHSTYNFALTFIG
jgi:membrane protease YdiL (CAAX protease family)